MIGQTLSHYRIVEKIGTGGMGEVYKAHDERLGRDVAIKVLREDLAANPDRLRRFEQEARSASALNHPNIVTIHDIGKHEATHYIAMEFVEGKTLRDKLSEGPLPTKKLLQFATQIAEGLAKAHSAGIVHRDLKPENLMVTSDGYVKILDFGLAKLLPEAEAYDSEMTTMTKELTRAGVVLGIVGYMSPEQASGRAVDHRSDQFSLGAILYEMATGKVAFKRDAAAETLAAIIEGEPEPVEKINPNVPAHLRAIVERCLEKDPEERYESTRDLARELEGLREVPFELPAILTRRTVLAGILGVVILGLALLVGLNVGGLRDRLTGGVPPIDSLAVLPLANPAGDPEQEYFVNGITEALITDLAKISALKVISRNSTMRYKDTDKSIPEIAGELGVDAVIEGSVLREGDRVRIAAQLIDARTSQHLWDDNFDRELRDVMTLYSDVARTIAQQIEIAVTPEEETRLASVRPVDPEVYEAYLKGEFHQKKMSPGDLETALQYFELALEKDPDYAPAHAGTAMAWATLAQQGFAPEALPRAKAAALRAVELDGNLANAHHILASLKTWGEWDWEGADEAFQRAIELNPSAPWPHATYSHFLNIVKRPDEAMAQIERAVELDPLDPTVQAFYSVDLLFARRYDEAIAQAKKALRTAPNHFVAKNVIFWEYHGKGMHEEQWEAMKEYYAMLGLKEVVDALDHGYAEGGYQGAMSLAAEALAERAEKGSVLFYEPAIAYIFAGNKNRALDWVERGFETHDPNMPYLGLPVYDSLRDDPRFKDILRRMNLPE